MKCVVIYLIGSDVIVFDIVYYGNWGEDDGILKIGKF